MSQFLTPQQYFRLQGGRPRKRFGQHFLAQPATAERIVESAELRPSELAVEIGPGLGALTRFILPKVQRLVLIELDRELAEYLGQAAASVSTHVTVYQQDVLDFDFKALSEAEGRKLVVLGNLPYNITSPLIFRLLESMAVMDRAVFMVQKEVGERLAASPGSKDYGVLSVLLGVFAQVTPLFKVGPGQFFPPPKVDSLVLSIRFCGAQSNHSREDLDHFDFLRHVVNISFQQRRKTLRNSLKGLMGGDTARLEEAFAASGVDPGKRPEALSPTEFLELAKALMTGSSSPPPSSSFSLTSPQ